MRTFGHLRVLGAVVATFAIVGAVLSQTEDGRPDYTQKDFVGKWRGKYAIDKSRVKDSGSNEVMLDALVKSATTNFEFRSNGSFVVQSKDSATGPTSSSSGTWRLQREVLMIKETVKAGKRVAKERQREVGFDVVAVTKSTIKLKIVERKAPLFLILSR